MIKGYIYSIALLTSIMLLFTSCGEKEEKLVLHTPEFNMISSVDNHAVIFSYDFMKLMDKSKVQNSEDMPMEVKMVMSLYLGKMLNSSNMGIRLEGNNHTVITTTDNGDIDFGFLTAEVVNEDKVKKGIKDFFKGKDFEEDGLHFIEHNLSHTLAAWDSSHIIFIYTENDTLDLKIKAKAILDARKIEGAENAVLENYLEREDDINVIMYLDKWMELAKKEANEVELDEDFLSLYDDTYIISSGNFLPGKIVFEMEMHGDKLKDSKYNLLPGNPISNEFMSYLSNEVPMMFGVASVNMDAIFNMMLQNDEMQAQFSNRVKEIGWTEKEMRGLFTGEFSASLIGVEMKPNPYYELQDSLMADDFFADIEELNIPNPSEIPSPVYLVTIGLNDPDKLKALFTTLHIIENKEGYFIAGSDGFFVFSGNKLMVTSDESIATTIGSGKKLKEYKSDSDITSSLYGEIIPNLDNLPQGFKDMVIENAGNEGEELLKFMNEFEKVTFSGSFDKMKLEVVMADKETNSIEVITGKLMKQVMQNMSLFM
jgi:hypothetical protein